MRDEPERHLTIAGCARVALLLTLMTIGLAAIAGCASSDGESGFEDRASIGDFLGLKKWTQTYPGGAKEEYWLRRTLDGEWIQHGDYTRWHPNGKKAIQAYYFNGKPLGKVRMWDEAGNLLSNKGAG